MNKQTTNRTHAPMRKNKQTFSTLMLLKTKVTFSSSNLCQGYITADMIMVLSDLKEEIKKRKAGITYISNFFSKLRYLLLRQQIYWSELLSCRNFKTLSRSTSYIVRASEAYHLFYYLVDAADLLFTPSRQFENLLTLYSSCIHTLSCLLYGYQLNGLM